VRVISLEEQLKRFKKWRKKPHGEFNGLLNFLVGQHQAFRTQRYEHRGHLSEPLARRIHDDDRFEYMLIATGEVTASSKIPIFDIYRRKRMER
jgi:hypothetical protein